MQTTRGCPYDCDFCDVIHLFGRKPRHKPIENVLKEIEALQKLGAKRIFLCDDDFVGDQKWAKQFLRELLPLNNSFPVPMGYTTQATITAAADEELLQLMADCNFFQLHIGIETPNAEGLKEANKLQNLRTDLVESCKKIQAYGIQVRALMIVGFDSDDKTIFDEHIKFIEDAHITGVAINVLKAYPGTPLWMRLQKENRVLDMTGTYRVVHQGGDEYHPEENDARGTARGVSRAAREGPFMGQHRTADRRVRDVGGTTTQGEAGLPVSAPDESQKIVRWRLSPAAPERSTGSPAGPEEGCPDRIPDESIHAGAGHRIRPAAGG